MNRIQQLSRDILRGKIVVPLDDAADASKYRARLRPGQARPQGGEARETPASRSTR